MDNNVLIGQRINTALAARDKLQKDLAQYLGVTDNTISYFCKGRRVPNVSQIIKISEFLNVSTDYLLGKEVPMTADVSVQEMVNKTGLSEDIVLRLIAWNNIDNSTATVDAASPEYLKQISEDLNWVSKKDSFSDLVIEFTNCILSAYLESPRTITRWHQGYMYSLYTWYSALKSNNEHQIYSKADEIEKEIQNFGLVTLTAEESAELRLSNIMTFLKDRFSDKAKQLIFTVIDGNSSSKDET